MIAGLNKGKIISPMTFEGHCDTDVFNTWFEKLLIPNLQPGQTIILDNASFHKFKKSVSSLNKLVLNLPTYSPDFNKIEHHWFSIKNRARKNIPLLKSFRLAVDYAFLPSSLLL